MFWRILKKDLKRKKTMNIILLLFVILCSMLAAASLNNIIAVTGGIEHFIEISDAPDVMINTPFDQELEKKLIALLRAESKLGGYHVQFNVVKKETLMDALDKPQDYKDLLVRVAGYSAYFVELRQEAQDLIINRTENAAW